MWFNSEYYHILYQNRNEEEAQKFILNLLKYLNVAKDKRFIDLACGKGRHSHFIAKQGYEVLGIDLAADSITYAKAQKTDGKASFEVHDLQKMLNPAWGKFDVLCNLFTSFGYFERDEIHLEILKHWRAAAQDNALVIIDFMNVPKVIAQLCLHEEKEVSGILFDLKRYVENGYICKEIKFWDKGNFYEFKERVRAFELSDFEKMFAESGWGLVDCFGNYDLVPYDFQASERCILIARAI